jgi:cystathionine beta-lyase/cystathionine gamma-synthase
MARYEIRWDRFGCDFTRCSHDPPTAERIGAQLAGIPDHQIRLSIGGEDPADVIDGLDRALAAP